MTSSTTSLGRLGRFCRTQVRAPATAACRGPSTGSRMPPALTTQASTATTASAPASTGRGGSQAGRAPTAASTVSAAAGSTTAPSGSATSSSEPRRSGETAAASTVTSSATASGRSQPIRRPASPPAIAAAASTQSSAVRSGTAAWPPPGRSPRAASTSSPADTSAPATAAIRRSPPPEPAQRARPQQHREQRHQRDQHQRRGDGGGQQVGGRAEGGADPAGLATGQRQRHAGPEHAELGRVGGAVQQQGGRGEPEQQRHGHHRGGRQAQPTGRDGQRDRGQDGSDGGGLAGGGDGGGGAAQRPADRLVPGDLQRAQTPVVPGQLGGAVPEPVEGEGAHGEGALTGGDDRVGGQRGQQQPGREADRGDDEQSDDGRGRATARRRAPAPYRSRLLRPVRGAAQPDVHRDPPFPHRGSTFYPRCIRNTPTARFGTATGTTQSNYRYTVSIGVDRTRRVTRARRQAHAVVASAVPYARPGPALRGWGEDGPVRAHPGGPAGGGGSVDWDLRRAATVTAAAVVATVLIAVFVHVLVLRVGRRDPTLRALAVRGRHPFWLFTLVVALLLVRPERGADPDTRSTGSGTSSPWWRSAPAPGCSPGRRWSRRRPRCVAATCRSRTTCGSAGCTPR